MTTSQSKFEEAIEFHQKGQFKKAVASYDSAIANKSDFVAAYFNRGVALQSLLQLEAAVESFEHAITLKPNYWEAYFCRGCALEKLNRLEEALDSYNCVIALEPNYAESFSNRGNVLQALKQLNAAIESYNRAIAINPNLAEAYSNRANIFIMLRHFDQAIADYEKAISLSPNNAGFHWFLAWCYLLMGDFAHGWEEHEWRNRYLTASFQPDFINQPSWTGKQSLSGKTILLWCENGGFGDSIHFVRYVENISQLGATIYVLTQAELKPLFESMSKITNVILYGQPLPDCDYQCSILSLPHRFKTNIDTIPAKIPYLTSNSQKVDTWKYKLNDNRLKIGIVWKSNANYTGGAIERYIDLAELLSVFDENILVVSLRNIIDEHDQEILNKHPHVLHFEDELHDFSDTAALIECLDLVISIDTAVAHLAGAMGKPVWILLWEFADWRWLLDREDSPWYPTAYLFRQDKEGDWSNVIKKIKAKLSSTY